MEAQLPRDEAARLEALQRYRILDTPQENDFDEVVKLAAEICETPIALVSLVDRDRQWFKGRYGLELTETPRRLSFCAHSILQAPAMTEVPDALKDARFADNELVTGRPGIRFYAAAPLVSQEGQALGTLCVIDTKPRQLTAKQQETLRVLGRQVMMQLELRRRVAGAAAARAEESRRLEALVGERTAELARANEELRRKEERFRTLAEATFEGVVFHKLGRIVDCNAQFAAILGHTPRELAGRDLREFLPPEEQALALRAAREQRESKLEVHLHHQDGSWRVVEVRGRELGEARLRVATVRDVTERKRREEALRAIVKATAPSGEEFFRALVAELGKLLGVKYALVGVLVPGEPERVRTVGMWCQGAVEENCEYELAGSPCADVVGKGLCHYPSEVQRLFPRDKMLEQAGVVSYLGIPLFSSAGTALGVLCVMDDQPMPNSELASSLMTIFAARAAAEVERMEALANLKGSEAKLRERAEELETIMASAPVALWVAHDPQCNYIVGNRMAGSLDKANPQTNWSANVPSRFRWFREGRQLEPEELPMQQAARKNIEIHNTELELVFPSGNRVSLLGSAVPLRDGQGRVRGCVGAFLDISTRKQAQEALQRSEEQMRLFLRSAPASIAVFDREMRYLAASHRWMQDYGLTGDVLGRRHYELFPEVPERWKEVHRRALAGETLKAEADRFERAGGRVQWVKWEVLPWHTAAGEIGGIMIVSEEITRAKEAEEALRQSEERLALVVNAAKLGTWDWNLASGELVWSPYCRELFGLRPDREMSYEQFLGALHEEDRGRVDAAVRRALDRHEDYDVEMRTVWADGSEHWVRSRGQAYYDAQGRPVRMSGAAMDVTELKGAEAALRQSEERFRTMADAMPQLAWIARPDGHIFWYNRRWYEYTGTRPEEMEGWGWQQVHDPQVLAAVLERWRRSLASGEPLDLEVSLRGADGVFHPFLTRVVPLKDERGRVVWWLGTNTDIREIVAARETLARSREDLERLVRERTAQLAEANANLQNFAYTAAHDLRSPLRGITSFSELVLAQYGARLDERGHSMLQRVVESAGQMGHLLNDLLEYSKITQQELRLERVQLEQAAGGVLRLLESDIRAKQAEVRVSGPLPEVIGHPATVVMLISNLVSNGLKFVPEGVRPRINIWAERRSDAGRRGGAAREWVRLWVEDNGIGLALEDQEKVFGAFQRLHAKGTYPGTGLGLAIVRKGVERMGGRVGVESEVGKGCRFWVELRSAD